MILTFGGENANVCKCMCVWNENVQVLYTQIISLFVFFIFYIWLVLFVVVVVAFVSVLLSKEPYEKMTKIKCAAYIVFSLSNNLNIAFALHIDKI